MERLTRAEKVAESLYYRVRKGMDKDEFIRCMNELQARENGLLGTAYCSWLLLHQTPDCEEKERHLDTVREQLQIRAANNK